MKDLKNRSGHRGSGQTSFMFLVHAVGPCLCRGTILVLFNLNSNLIYSMITFALKLNMHLNVNNSSVDTVVFLGGGEQYNNKWHLCASASFWFQGTMNIKTTALTQCVLYTHVGGQFYDLGLLQFSNNMCWKNEVSWQPEYTEWLSYLLLDFHDGMSIFQDVI